MSIRLTPKEELALLEKLKGDETPELQGLKRALEKKCQRAEVEFLGRWDVDQNREVA